MSSPRVDTFRDQDGEILAMIVRSSLDNHGVHFVTPNDFQQQVALMSRPAGEVIPPHTHLPVPRSLRGTQEVLIIQRGEMSVELYSSSRKLVARECAKQGDVVILVSGGHGFEMTTDCQFVEVKQGPFVPGKDKEVFAA